MYAERIHGVDTAPSVEGQREVHEVVLGWREAVIAKNARSGRSMRFRAQNNYKVFVGEDGGKYHGVVPMEDGVNYPYELDGKAIVVKPIEFVEGRRRRFELVLDSGLELESPDNERTSTG